MDSQPWPIVVTNSQAKNEEQKAVIHKETGATLRVVGLPRP